MRFDFLSKYFPLPQFINPPRIGISFSDSKMKAVFFDDKNKANDARSLIIPLEKGTITEGKITNKKELLKKISILKETFNSKFVSFSIPDEITYIFNLSVPVSKGVNITESISFNVEENVPISLADSIFDFIPVEVTKSDSGFEAKVVVAVCVKKEVEKFTEVIRESGLDLLGAIHESQAISNSVIPKDLKDTSCIVHARQDRVGIYLVKDGVVYFSTIRSISPEGNYKDQFMDEYVKFLEYSMRYGSRAGNSVNNVFVCGEFDYAKIAVESLVGSKEGVKYTKLSNVWVNAIDIEKVTPNISFEDSLNLAGPLGLVLSRIV